MKFTPISIFFLGLATGAAATYLVMQTKAPDSLKGEGKKIQIARGPGELQGRKSQMQIVEIEGEVVDAWCYASQTMGPGRGKSHKACALKCVGGGITPGIVQDGTDDLFLAVKYRGYEGCNALLLPYVGERVRIKGFVGINGGQRVMRIQSVAPIKDDANGADLK